MADTELTLTQIETLLTCYPSSPWYIRRNIVIPNVDWGFLNHEADLLILSKSNYLTEIEIKRSWVDFKNDFKKKHTHQDKKLSHFYYAVPYSVAEKVFNWLYEGEFDCPLDWRFTYTQSKVTGYKETNLNKCGLIIYADKDLYRGIPICGINVPAARIGNYKVSVEEELSLLRLLGLRVWKLKQKLAEK